MDRYVLSDAQRAKIEPHCLGKPPDLVGYEPIAELLFDAMLVDGYFMGRDNGRSGGLVPLRFLPKG